jgi:hypothetical protein
MRTYDRAWRAFWSMVAGVGVGLAVLESSAVGVLLTFSLLLVLCCCARRLLPRVLPGLRPLDVAIGILTVWAFCWVSPAVALLVVLAAGTSCPALVGPAVRSARRSTNVGAGGGADPRRRQPPLVVADASSGLTVQEAMGPLQGLDDRQLCRLWRESFWLLRQPRAPGTVLCLVALREACLDELERRDACALRAWLDNGARASGGPEKYLSSPPRRDPDAA